ncbi:MAG: amidohydrolase [Lentimicrobiaceae bacterium]|jgi:amidohydrolase|nr:amidohydrolase [Lentimicrobiaceae bacterium]
MLLKTTKSLALLYFNEIVAIRRHIHRHPELSFHEYKTAAFIREKLLNWGLKNVKSIVDTGVVATIEGKNPLKKTIALRADIDALPITEQSSAAYTSENAGVMHACGHDAHTAMLLGVAKILHEMRDRFEGSVQLIFQPAEEKLPGGAQRIVESGVLNGTNCIVGQHVFPDLEVGKVGFCKGKYMAASDEIDIVVKGIGGHAAYPERVINPIFIASKMLLVLEEMNRNESPKNSRSVLNFGCISGEGTYNVVPETVCLKGTMRTFDETWRSQLKNSIHQIAQQTASDENCEIHVSIQEGYPYLQNDTTVTELAMQTAAKFVGTENCVTIPQQMTSEDFAFYSHQMPACFYRIGTANVSKGITSKLHSSKFDIDEKSLELGMGLMSYIALQLLENN